MRMAQKKGESAQFQRAFGDILTSLHSNYKRNTLVRGVRTEFLREIEQGLFISQNAFCLRGTYHHCFCLTLHKELPKPYLLSPFTIGGRFDHNYHIQRAVSECFGHHVTLSCSHNFRKGWEDIVARCSQEAEKHLSPHYLKIFQKSKKALLSLAEFIKVEGVKVDSTTTLRGSEYLIGILDCDMKRFMKMYMETDQREFFLKELVSTKPELFEQLHKKDSINIKLLKK